MGRKFYHTVSLPLKLDFDHIIVSEGQLGQGNFFIRENSLVYCYAFFHKEYEVKHCNDFSALLFYSSLWLHKNSTHRKRDERATFLSSQAVTIVKRFDITMVLAGARRVYLLHC